MDEKRVERLQIMLADQELKALARRSEAQAQGE